MKVLCSIPYLYIGLCESLLPPLKGLFHSVCLSVSLSLSLSVSLSLSLSQNEACELTPRSTDKRPKPTHHRFNSMPSKENYSLIASRTESLSSNSSLPFLCQVLVLMGIHRDHSLKSKKGVVVVVTGGGGRGEGGGRGGGELIPGANRSDDSSSASRQE